MQLLANYRQTALEQMQNLVALSKTEVIQQPPTTLEVWGLRILIATLVLLLWWSIMEDQMNNIYEGWLGYLKKEENATTGSLKLYYRRLKELHRDKALIKSSIKSQFDSALDTKNTLLDYVNTQIGILEAKVEEFNNDEEELPNFHD